MSKEKQIDEMAKVICGSNKDCKTCVHHFEIRGCGCLFYANRIYEAGYRKQSDLTPCDVCQFNPPSSTDGKPCSVCPAQAKMKGGAE